MRHFGWRAARRRATPWWWWTWPVVLLLTASAFTNAAAAGDVMLEIATGSSGKAPADLRVFQAGFPPHTVPRAGLVTEAFTGFAPGGNVFENYYSIRVGYFPTPPSLHTWTTGYEFEFLHDKAIYRPPPDQADVVQHFELSDGLNQLMVNVVRDYGMLPAEGFADGRIHVLTRIGLGPVVTVPETIIRGVTSGVRGAGDPVYYTLAGFGGQVAVQGRYFLSALHALAVELKATAADTHNRTRDGTVSAFVVGAHLTVGLTVRLR